MRRSGALLAVTLLLLVLQAVAMRGPVIRADVASLIVLYLALERPVIRGAGVALVVGYLNDLFAGTERGLHALGLVMLFFIVRLLVARVAGGRFVFVTLVAVLGTLLSMTLVFLIEHNVGPGRSTFDGIAPAILPTLLSAAVLGYPCYRLLKALDERLKEPEDDFVFRGER